MISRKYRLVTEKPQHRHQSPYNHEKIKEKENGMEKAELKRPQKSSVTLA